MSLRVWLPLTKDLRNQGLDDITVTNNGATFNSTGKLGGCYQFGPNKNIKLMEYASTFSSFNEFSLSVWFKCTAQNTGHSGSALISCGDWNQSTHLLNLALCYYNTDHYTTLLITSNSGWSYGYSYNFQLNTWYHVVLTTRQEEVKAYVNGELIGNSANAIVPTDMAQNWICIGNGTYYSGFTFNGFMNDIRIYDHCLSPMEVKEISKGLVLHYPLDGHNETLVPFGYQQLEYIEGNGSSYFNTGYKFNPETDACKVEFKGNDASNNGMIFADSGGRYFWLYYYGTNGIRVYADNGTGQQGISGIPSDLNKHIVEYKSKHYYIDGIDKGSLSKTYTEDTNTIWLFSYGGASYPFKGRIYYTDIKRNNKIQKIYIPAKRISDSVVGMYELVNNDFFVSASTAFTAGPVIKAPSIIYDCSGFCNNGITFGTLTISNNTPKYKISTVFNGVDNCIQIGNWYTLFQNPFTINVWFKKDEIGSKGYETLLGGGSGFEIDTRAGNSQTLSLYLASARGTAYSPFNFAQWYMVTMVSDGTNELYYVDGILRKTIEKKNIPNNMYRIGAWSSDTSQNFKGQMSDFRIYATALSADDVKSLYNNLAYIDNQGNIYGAVYEEV